MLVFLAVLLALLLILLAAPARAAEPCDTERAAAMRAEGSDAAYSAAVAAWGLCEEKAGRFAAAHRLVSRALEAAPSETTTAGRAPRWTALRAALRRLDERVVRVLVTWDAGELHVDGQPVVAVSGAVLAVDPGRRLFEARKDGKVLAAREVEARAGDLPTVDLRAVGNKSDGWQQIQIVATNPPVSKSAPPSPFLPALSPRGAAVGVAYASGAVALAAGIVAGILEAQRVSLRAGLAPDACPTPDASARCAELRQVFEQRTGARNTALVAAGVAVAAGGLAVGLHFAEGRARTAGMVTVGGTW